MLSFLRNRFFGTWDRTLTTIAAVASVVGAIISIFLIEYPKEIPSYIKWRDIFIFSGMIITITILSGRYVRREVTIFNQNRIMSKRFTNSHELTHNFRSHLFGAYYRNMNKVSSTPAEKSLLSRICSDVTESVKISLVEYFRSVGIEIGQDIRIAVKLLITSDEAVEILQGETDSSPENLRLKNNWIITIYRDNDTYQQLKSREITTRINSVDGNTASHTVINLRRDLFSCDDLISLGHGYSNENREWDKQYNSTLVVPIRYKPDDQSRREYRCYGLLCVDSLNKEKRRLYERQECFEIVSHAADLLAIFFLVVGLTDHQPSDGRSGPGVAPIRSRPVTIPEGGLLTEPSSVHEHNASPPPTGREA